MDQRNADAFNGMIVSDSEVEDPEDYLEENKEAKSGSCKTPKSN